MFGPSPFRSKTKRRPSSSRAAARAGDPGEAAARGGGARGDGGAQDRRGVPRVHGRVLECEDNWNCQIDNITFTAKDGKVSQLEHVFIRGSRVRFMIIPDMLKNAPMFKRLEARIRGKGSAIGVGRGRAVAMRARRAILLWGLLIFIRR
ncbi:hypothetical protein GUJ93_ZPchr0013g37265 [Zizania palustris]|uniref:Small nuclear ribonucleoprotein Sm D3 n=1 Tax=Zizania palustris TaxID=103762 RepID=A0A8J5WTS2_ZIZPA|nr:hypothetical protein GUJ93_ZPchr0013g37265 [Zizania palustris]